MKVFAAHNPDSEVRKRSSAGGIFSLLAEDILNQGGVVYGAAFDKDWKVVHKRIDKVSDLDALRRSKYVYSHLGSAIIDAYSDLNEGKKVLFCSVPCQVAAMRKKAGHNPNLLLVEVVCHGAPEPVYWDKYLSELCKRQKREISDIESINFRDKRTGWKNYSFTIKFKDGKEFTEPHDDNLYMRAFLADYTLREACFDCKFKYPNGSKADLTIGDFWGISQLAQQIDNDKGTTLVIQNSDELHVSFSKITEIYNTTLPEVVKFNPAIAKSPVKPSKLNDTLKQLKSENPIYPILKKLAKKPFNLRLKILVHKLLFSHIRRLN